MGNKQFYPLDPSEFSDCCVIYVLIFLLQPSPEHRLSLPQPRSSLFDWKQKQSENSSYYRSIAVVLFPQVTNTKHQYTKR